MKYNALLDKGQPEKELQILTTQEEYTPYLNEIDGLSKEIKTCRGKIFNAKKSTIKNMFYSGVKVPSLWTTKQNYRDILTNVISQDPKFLDYVSKVDINKQPVKTNKNNVDEFSAPDDIYEDHDKKSSLKEEIKTKKYDYIGNNLHQRTSSGRRAQTSQGGSRPISTQFRPPSIPLSTRNNNNFSESGTSDRYNINTPGELNDKILTSKAFETGHIGEAHLINPIAQISGGVAEAEYPIIDAHGKINFPKVEHSPSSRKATAKSRKDTGANNIDYERKIRALTARQDQDRKIRTATARTPNFKERISTGSIRGMVGSKMNTQYNTTKSNDTKSPPRFETRIKSSTKRANSDAGTFLHVIQTKKVEIKNPEIKKLLTDIDNLGPYFSHCLSCNNRNLSYVSELRIEDAKNYAEIIRNSDHRASQLIPGFARSSKR